MGKAILLLIASVALGSSVLLFNGVHQGRLQTETELNTQEAGVLAREIALTGLGEAEQALYSDYLPDGVYGGANSFTGQYQGGTYAATLTLSGTIFTLKSVGTFDGVTHTLLRTYDGSGTTTTTTSVPPYFANAITCDGNFTVSNNVTLGAPAGENGNVHTNGNIEIWSGDVTIQGFGYHKGNANSTNGDTLDEVFVPNVNPGGLAHTQKVPEVAIPTFNPSAHAGLATQTTSGDLNLSGTVALGTAASPKIWYVSGNIKTTGNVTFTGYGMFITPGNIEIYHNVILSGASTESTLGFYTSGNIYVKNGSLTTAGQWFTNGNVELEGNTNFTGTMTLKGNVILKGSVNMTYRDAASSLTNPIWPYTTTTTTSGLEVVSVREW